MWFGFDIVNKPLKPEPEILDYIFKSEMQCKVVWELKRSVEIKVQIK